MARVDLTGQRFGMLTVIEAAPDHIQPAGKHIPMWRCKCDCGNERIVSGNSLVQEEVYSCGCMRRNHWEDVDVDIKRPAPLTVQYDLMLGRTYKIKGKRLKLVGLYSTYARFEDEIGQHDCYLYYDLQRMMR